MKKALVTGASGFLGRHLVPELEGRGWHVTPMTSADTFVPITRGYDVIFHLAAWTQAGSFSSKHQGDQWLINQRINTEVLEWWNNHECQAKLITIGSSCAYAPGENLEEVNYMRGEPHESLYSYAMTKRMLYEGCRALNKQYGMNYLYLVPSTLYGPDYHTDGRQAHFIFDLVRKIIRGRELGEEVVLWGDGYQRRDLIYVADFVRLMLKLNDIAENEIFNLSGQTETIMIYANEISKLVGYDDGHIIFDPTKHVGAVNKSLSILKAKDALHFTMLTPLDQGLQSVVNWYYETGSWK